MAASADGQSFDNRGTYYIPPNNGQINALNFINQPGGVFNFMGSSVFYSTDTLNYTNLGNIICTPGFDFETVSSTTGQRRMAANFVNQPVGFNSGIINAGGTFAFQIAPGLIVGNLTGNSKLLIAATNIINAGTITMDASSLMRLTGKNVDLSYGSLEMSTPDSSGLFLTNIFGTNVNFTSLFNAGILDYYWTARTATNPFVPSTLVNNFTPLFTVTNRNFQVYLTDVLLQSPVAYVKVTDTAPINSNRLTQAVFLSEPDTNFANSVYFTPFEIAVQWQWTTPNWPDKSPVTNYLYLTDNFGEVTNIGVVNSGYVNPQALYPTPTYRPMNYNFTSGTPYPAFVPASIPGLPPGTFTNGELTNQYAGWSAMFTSATALPTDNDVFNVTNLAGRIEITADNILNLTGARITARNYLRLQTTNHFAGSPNARIVSPWSDINLRTTNSFLTVTNLMAPFIPRCYGTVEMWSGRWTNTSTTNLIGATNTFTVTNSYHVLFVNSMLAPTTTPYVQNLALNVTNAAAANSPGDLVISDVLNVASNIVLNARSITVTTNDPDAFTAAGQLNVVSPTLILYPTNFPNLQYFTNSGQVVTYNQIYLGDAAAPLQTFVNHGIFADSGSTIAAKYVECDGILYAGLQQSGSILFEQANSVVVSNGFLYAPSGVIGINARDLVVSNEFVYSGGLLDFWITNSITDLDGGLFNGNNWAVSGSFNMHLKPATGDLLATTISNVAPPFVRPNNIWAGEDRGRSPTGFGNNCALGHLILDGGSNSVFVFSPATGTNALYVDELELRDSTTLRDSSGNLTGVSVAPNMRIYFAQAVANGASIAEKLNGKNGGALVWVPAYAGTFSSTNILYPDGNVYTLNAALVQSQNLDSDGDGIVNSADPSPVFVPSQLQFRAAKATPPATGTVLAWQTVGLSTNYVFYNSSLANPNWLLLTNASLRTNPFVFGPNNGLATVVDPLTSSNRYYKVRVDVRQP